MHEFSTASSHSENGYCFQSVCLSVCVCQHTKSGSGDIDCSVDHHISGWECFGGCLSVLLSQQNIISTIALQPSEETTSNLADVCSWDRYADRVRRWAWYQYSVSNKKPWYDSTQHTTFILNTSRKRQTLIDTNNVSPITRNSQYDNVIK